MSDEELKEILENEFPDIRCDICNHITISPKSITHRPFEIKWFKNIEEILEKLKTSIEFRYFIFTDSVDLINFRMIF